jgi:hypothetical protein
LEAAFKVVITTAGRQAQDLAKIQSTATSNIAPLVNPTSNLDTPTLIEAVSITGEGCSIRERIYGMISIA